MTVTGLAASDRGLAWGGMVFDIHGLVAVRVEEQTPGAAQLRDMLGPFAGESQAAFELLVRGPQPPVPRQSMAEDVYRFTADSLTLPRDRVTIVRSIDGFRVEGSGELLTAVIPVLDRLCVMQRTAMVHAAIVDYRGAGVLMPAWGGVGKTSTIAKLVALPGVRFLADDWGFLRGDGTLLGYAKPLFIKPHHREIYPQLFVGPRKPLAPGRLIAPLSRVATAVHPVIVRYPRAAAFTRRWSPEHRMVAPVDVFGSENIASSVPVRLALFLERFDADDASLHSCTHDWMACRIVGNFHTELPLVSRRLIEALGSSGLVPLDRHFSEKTAVVARALSDVPCKLLRLPVAWSADRASDYVTGVVSRLVGALDQARGEEVVPDAPD
ncbi:hypothetical protein [Rathayibacter soli]|uniref:hypothetical protein n=1 Tax=Rathayibacter soli TaxID=3144168 RepID=UPI0027E527FF|nr:hypothetical protein [Glaciibacter superstes]